MRISDWSSDVCSSDLVAGDGGHARGGDVAGGLDRVDGLAGALGRGCWGGVCVGFVRRGFAGAGGGEQADRKGRSEEHTSELQSLMRISYAVFCLKKKNNHPHSFVFVIL